MQRRHFPWAFILFLSLSSAYADRDYPGDGCDTWVDPSRTQLTIYGDSLSQLVTTPAYGAADWELYFTLNHPEVHWDIQNLGTSGWRTMNIYNRLRECARTQPNRENFRTAANVAFEMGGNDYIYNLPVLVYIPWSLPRIQGAIIYNTRLFVRALHHPRRHKNVLVMGNFPTIATSPTLGKVSDFFHWGQNTVPGPLADAYQDIMVEKRTASWEDLTQRPTFAATIGLRLAAPLAEDLATRVDLESETTRLKTWADNNILGHSAGCSYMAWYCAWLEFNSDNMGFNAVSIAMLFHQGPLEAMAAEENAQFLPLYPYFIRHADCRVGHCYVGNAPLYNDPVHVSYAGYYRWTAMLSTRLVQLGWLGLPTNGGSVDDPAVYFAPEPDPVDTSPPPPPIELLIACFIFHWCHF